MAGKLLIVDDEEDLAQALKDYFEMKGFTVTVIAKGEETLAWLKQESPEVVLLDVLLKGKMNGIDVLRQIRVDSPRLKIIMLTGSDIKAYEKEAGDLGVSRYIKKPITVSRLYENIKEVLAEKP